MVATDGAIIKRGERFGFRRASLVIEDIRPDLARVAKIRNRPVRGIGGKVQRDPGDTKKSEVTGVNFRILQPEEAKPLLPVGKAGAFEGGLPEENGVLGCPPALVCMTTLESPVLKAMWFL